MRNLLEGRRLHYRVASNAPEGAFATPSTTLEEFAYMLPHGSGLDTDWTMNIRANGKGLALYTEFHHMNENGYYDGWFPVRIMLDRDAAGKLSVGNIRLNQEKLFGVDEMLGDELHEVCKKANGVA